MTSVTATAIYAVRLIIPWAVFAISADGDEVTAEEHVHGPQLAHEGPPSMQLTFA